MLRAVVQQMREEMEAMMATQRAQEEQLRVSMEELKERDRESSAERETERATEAERDGQIPTAVEARLTALEAAVAQRDAANQRLSSERDKVTRSLPPPPPSLSLTLSVCLSLSVKLMEINNRLRHNLTDAVNVANTAAAHHQVTASIIVSPVTLPY